MTSIPKYMIVAAAMIIGSCSNTLPYWDAKEHKYHIPAHNITVAMPPDIVWEIADNARLPDDVLFFCVNQELSLCAFVVCQPGFDRNIGIHEYPEKYIETAVAKVTQQERSANYSTPVITKCRYDSHDAVGFRQDVRIDSIGILYQGVLMVNNSNVYGIVTIEPSPVDSTTHMIAQKSLAGFNLIIP